MAGQVRSAADRLRCLYPEVLRQWEDRVREAVPAADEQDRLVLFDELPQFLARLVQVLDGELDEHLASAPEEVCKEHGAQRALETAYPLRSMMLEYRLLRQTLFEILEDEGPLCRRDRDRIVDSIEIAMEEAADTFSAIQQQELAERARDLAERDRLKNEFVATLAHELRTPLSAISNATFLLDHIQIDERALRQVGTVRRQVQHLARLVDDLMDVARISQGKLRLQVEQVDICQTLTEAAQVVAPVIESRGQELLCTLPQEALIVDADPARLLQVVVNLLDNAAKYTDAGGRIWLSAVREGEQAAIRVKDTGIGIDPVVLPQLFDLFAQVDPSSARTHGGLGIGLALVRRLVELHGGTVHAHSDGPSHGTEFVVCLPLAN